MALFGFKSSRKAEEEKEQAIRKVVQQNYTHLSNLSKGSQVNFAIPYFDVFDPRFMDTGCPVAVHGTIVYSIDDLELFHQVNKNEAYSDETFKNKLKGQVAKFVKGVVSNAPADAQIPVVQLERKIMEISEMVQSYVKPKVEQLFGITIRSLDITSINIDRDSQGYRELKALTAELEKERTLAQHKANISNFEQQNELEREMKRMQTIDAMKMQMEDQRERLKIERSVTEAGQMQMIKDGRRPTLGQGGMMGGSMMGLNAMGVNTMGGTSPIGMAAPPPMASTMYHVFLNGQQAGPFDINIIRQYTQQGLMNAQTQVWTQGMPQWAPAGTIPELASLFTPMSGTAPPPMGGNGSIPPPTL